jgi:RHS repeat-associated protein
MPSVLPRLTRLTAFLVILLCTPLSALCAANGVVFGPRDVTVGAWGVAASVHRFECEVSGAGSLVVTRRTTDKAFKGGFVLVNNSFFSLHEFLEGSQPVFVASVNLRATNVIGLTLIGAPGAALGIEVRAKSVVNLPQATFSATPESIALGQASMLQWTSTDAESLSITPDIGDVAASGSQSISPQATTTYTLTAAGPGGTVTRTATVTVIAPPPTVSFSVSPSSISAGETVVYAWSSTNAQSATIAPGIGSVAPSGTLSTSPAATTTYTITATGPGGTAQASATVTVFTAPSVTISAGSASIPLGSSTTLNWSTTDAQGVHIDQGIGSVPLQGTATVSPTVTTTYTLTAAGPGGTAGAKVTVLVLGSPAPPPSGSFGKAYHDQVPPDATVEAYDAKRFALVTGLVRDALGGGALEDVAVSIFDHPGYGTTATDRDGRFTLPVEGGGTLAVRFRKPGFISAQRQVQVPWNDIAVVETVSLVFEDAATTVVKFDGSPATVVTHRSTEISDSSGTRAATLVFTGDNKAYLTDKAGNTTLELKTISTRATEFSTIESMPAKLPPNSGYTYCVELGVDGAERVSFAKPVVMWVENFLGFAVGGVVPVGYYDRDRGVWIPADNGRVVRLLDRDGDGVTDALDADGDGEPDDLNGNGLYEDEVAGLNNPQQYAPGATFWRVAITHFTPWDCNWPYGPPADAAPPPNAEGFPNVDQQQTEEESCEEVSSFIEARSRIFHEDIPIPGTGMSLHYASNRVPGYRHLVSVPVSGPVVPQSLRQILVKLEIAGRTFETVLAPLPDQKAEFAWDGRDHLGREVSGSITAQVSIGFVYPAVYLNPFDLGQAFGQAGGSVTSIPTRQEFILWRRNDLIVFRSIGATIRDSGTIAEGWTLSRHHQMSLSDLDTIHRGDGFLAHSSGRILSTVAGTGEYGFSGDGGPATQADLYYPYHLTIHPSGDLYFADAGNGRIRKIDREGIITTVAGVGNCWGEYWGDGGPAVEACLDNPAKAVFDVSGNLYIVENTSEGRIRKVDTNGIITTVASGLGNPRTIAVDPSGNIYFAESDRIKKIDPSGTITTLVLNVDLISDLALDSAGELYISDYYFKVKKMDTTGRVTTVAGTGAHGYSGDGGPATQARFGWNPGPIAFDRAGNLYITDPSNGCVRKVDSRGIIITVAGNGTSAAGVDGKPATQTSLDYPYGIAVGLDGSLYVSEPNASRIRKISQPAGLIVWDLSGEIPFAEENGLGHIFSSAGRHLKTMDLETGSDLYKFDYDADGRIVFVSDRFGNSTAIERDAAGRPFAVVSPDGMRTTLAVDSRNHLTGIRYPDGSAYGFEYTAAGLLTAKIEPAGNRFEHFFDSAGRLESASDQEQGNWQFAQSADAAGLVTSTTLTAEGAVTTYQDRTESTGAYTSRITDAAGGETVFSSAADGLTSRKSLSCGMVLDLLYGADTHYKFRTLKQTIETAPSNLKRTTLFEKTYQDTNGDWVPDRITQTVTLNGKVTTRLNDNLQGNTVITTPQGRTTTVAYDPQNLLVSRVRTPNLYDTQYSYDARGRTTIVTSNTRQTALAYDINGNLAALTDSLGRQTRYEYDAVGRVTGVTRPDGSFVGFSHDGNGNLTVLVNPSGVAHKFNYNKVNRPSGYTTPLSGSYQYRYDRDRRPTETVLPSGRIIRNFYDQGRLMRTETLETPEASIYFNYLCGSKLGSITKSGEGISYTYDGSLLTSETASGSLNQAVSYSYNDDFARVQASYAGQATGYGYDNDGLLTQAGPFAITRHAGNGLPVAVSGAGLQLNRGFNGHGEIDSQGVVVSGRAVSSWSLLRDNAGRIVRKTEAAGGPASSYDYVYDANGRLLKVLKDNVPVEEYAYDENGTRVFEMNTLRGITGRSYEYSDEDHLLKAGEWTYQYNLDGFLTAKINSTAPTDRTLYSYSARGELLTVILPDGKPIDYVCDPLGRRIAKKVNGVVMEKYLWQGMTRLLAVYDGGNILRQRFEYADDRLPVAMQIGGSNYYLTYDQVGSLRLVADASGNVVKRITYDSFGSILEDTNSSFTVPFGFAGGLHDRDTGLVRFGYRDYDPEVGRWTAKDPIGYHGGDTDLFGYVLNDPLNFIDLYGFSKFLIKQFVQRTAKAVANAYLGGIDPSGRRIISAGVGGAASGAVVGALVGTPALGVGAGPSALGGAIIGFSGGLLIQTSLEAVGLGQVIEDFTDEMIQNFIDAFEINSKEPSHCP